MYRGLTYRASIYMARYIPPLHIGRLYIGRMYRGPIYIGPCCREACKFHLVWRNEGNGPAFANGAKIANPRIRTCQQQQRSPLMVLGNIGAWAFLLTYNFRFKKLRFPRGVVPRPLAGSRAASQTSSHLGGGPLLKATTRSGGCRAGSGGRRGRPGYRIV